MYCVRVFLDGVLKYEKWFDPYDVVEPIIYAEWIKIDGLYRCSKCNTTCPYDVSGDVIEYWDCPRCPKCGAHMR